MIRKPIPSEVIVDLYYKLSNLSPKHPGRKLLINETSKAFDVSLIRSFLPGCLGDKFDNL